jgi:hypothetical protein
MDVPIGFLPKPLSIKLDRLLPSRRISEAVRASRKFKQIRASIEEIGLIEPLSVSAVEKDSNTHMLLDGHIRLIVLRELGESEAACLVATDDESFTYNNRVNRLSTIQEHLMIKRAIDRGVSRQRLAKVFDIDASYIAKKVSLLDGICPEAAELLKDRQFGVDLTSILRKMKPTRQVECAELMISSNNFSLRYAKALLEVTAPALLVKSKKRSSMTSVSLEQMLSMEREMQAVQNQSKLLEEDYGADMLHLVLAQKYLAKILANERVARYLQTNHPEILEQFRSIAEATSTEQ